MDHFDIARTLKFLPGIILGLTVHEFSHAIVARWCGDSTSADQGRVTLNPLKHIDPLGFILLLVAGFGWAKPVQFNEQNLKNPRTDILKIAVAGPLSNAVLAMLLSVIMVLCSKMVTVYPGNAVNTGFEILFYAIFINWGLFVFNLIPLPPLDGSHILFHPFRRYPEVHDWLYKYGSLALFVILIAGGVSGKSFLPIAPAIQYLAEGFLGLLGYR
ncbi:MAG: site-2 protease family protein [Bacteroidales bacterium]|jgi:Zn-dependent protease